MPTWRQGLVLLVLCSCMLAPAVTFANPISFNFTVTAINGPLSGQTSSGTFTFDDSIIVPGGSISQVGLLTDLAFTWDGIAYDETTANTGLLSFDAGGNLTEVLFGTDCAPACAVAGGNEEWAVDLKPKSGGSFTYAISAENVVFQGTAAIPEPSTIVLLVLGLLSVGFSRRVMGATRCLPKGS